MSASVGTPSLRSQAVVSGIPGISDRVLSGLELGVQEQVDFTNALLEIKPEYLLTVNVARELRCGFAEAVNSHTSIFLEHPTHIILRDLVFAHGGIPALMKKRRKWKGRKGRVDIFVECSPNDECHIIELKNFNPQNNQVRLDLARFADLFRYNNTKHGLRSCSLAYPSREDAAQFLKGESSRLPLQGLGIDINTRSKWIITGAEPEDGYAACYCNVLTLTRL